MNFKKITIGLFFAIIIGMALATILLPKSEFSEIENRKLAKEPKLSVSSLMDKSFMKASEDYMADHMVFRTQFSKFKTTLERASGKKEVNDVFITPKMLLEDVKPPESKLIKSNIDAINEFAKKHSGQIDTQMMLVPSAIEFYKSEIPILAPKFDQPEFIKGVYDRLTGTGKVDSYSPLAASADEYIFYRTDHHWTSLGAYIGYTALAKPLGFKAATVDTFNIEYASHDFLGTLYSKVVCGENLKDSIDLYHYAPGNVVTDVIKYTAKNTQTYPSIFFKDNLDIKDKYTVFLGENEAVVKVKTNVYNGKKLIIFKDSFAHSLMQFLPLHYEEIVLVDLRYLNKPLENYDININDYQQALFLYSVAGFVKDDSVKKIALY